MSDPYEVLGVAPDAGLDEVRAARRRLAKQLHPDLAPPEGRGQAETRMREVNRAFDLAVRRLLDRPATPPPAAPPPPSPPRRPSRSAARPRRVWHLRQDAPSFTIHALRAEAFEALLVVGSWVGDVLDADPPSALELHLWEPSECWCRLDLLPEAGASMVTLTVGAVEGAPPPPTPEEVRDVLVAELNRLGGAPLPG